MKYTVVWLPAALNQLADLWNHAPDRKAITEAADRIDRLLAVDPEMRGQAYQGRRILFQPPLAVRFAVRPDDRLVEVAQVERISQ
jgi:plasmid stabilization system protein ParE